MRVKFVIFILFMIDLIYSTINNQLSNLTPPHLSNLALPQLTPSTLPTS
jgi:hypothetical protein